MVASLWFSLLEYFLSFRSVLVGFIEKSAASLIRALLYVTSCFYLAAFRNLSLSWNFVILIMMCLEVGLFGFLLIGTLCFLDLCDFFSHQIREIFHHYFFKQVFYPLLFFFFSSGIPIIWILLRFMLSCISLNPSSVFLSLFSLSCSFWVFFSPCPPVR